MLYQSSTAFLTPPLLLEVREGHAVIKRQLGTSTGGLKTVVDGISLYC